MQAECRQNFVRILSKFRSWFIKHILFLLLFPCRFSGLFECFWINFFTSCLSYTQQSYTFFFVKRKHALMLFSCQISDKMGRLNRHGKTSPFDSFFDHCELHRNKIPQLLSTYYRSLSSKRLFKNNDFAKFRFWNNN